MGGGGHVIKSKGGERPTVAVLLAPFAAVAQRTTHCYHLLCLQLGLQFTQSVLVMCQHLFVLGDLLLVEVDDALGGGQLGRFAIQSRDALPALL